MTSRAGAHAFRALREFLAGDAKVRAAAFPPPLWGRDRERGGGKRPVSTTRLKYFQHTRTPRLTHKGRARKLPACCYPSPCPSPTRQGNRIWKKVACSRLLRAGDVDRTYQPFALRFRSVPDPIPWPGMDTHVCRRPMQRTRLENFHMRYPCPTRGEGTMWHRRSQHKRFVALKRGTP
jgi:hypothetical protein